MKASISKSEILGTVTAPSSKSYTIRGLMCAALANGKSEIFSQVSLFWFHPLSTGDCGPGVG